eukprot:TRINITY_DN25576_c0_g1_i1.p1 TRINITY_DN25576_c0_g1~~TRINITY_DN25576_c0_g1_i1.p1  ORF type:complete len:645 (-),score=165.81 TRINITY_DN25576_c0_g1_i1:174-2087(-)
MASRIHGGGAFCLIQSEQDAAAQRILVLYGDIQRFDKLADIPRSQQAKDPKLQQFDTVSMIPFSQITERGFRAHNEGEKIITLRVSEWETLGQQAFEESIPDVEIQLAGELEYDTTREAYAKVIETVKEQMIGRGEGSSFVTPRKCSGRVVDFDLNKALVVFRRFLVNEYGCYWKFLFFDGADSYFIGASPERHLTVRNSFVDMNPISGTFRKTPDFSREQERDALLRFLKDNKEIDELCMVTDEELKMMCTMCSTGGKINGPLLKEMGALIHTEYELRGLRADRDCIDLFRESMFAPTVTGSPMGNACACVYTLEKSTRSYYSAAIVLLGREGEAGEEFLDSSITIRTIELHKDGSFAIRVGATLVKDSVPMEEVEETDAKIRGALRGLTTSRRPGARLALHQDEDVSAELPRRNLRLSRFWMELQDKDKMKIPGLQGKRIVIMNNEDDFAVMQRHILHTLGADVQLLDWSAFADESVWAPGSADLVLLGPGPGDPTNGSHAKMQVVHKVARGLIEQKRKIFAVCLGHQIMGHVLGFDIVRKAVPTQGVQEECDLFGTPELCGFYNTFYVRHNPELEQRHGFEKVTVLHEAELVAVKSPNFIGFQFHPESILTRNGWGIIRDAVCALLDVDPSPGH